MSPEQQYFELVTKILKEVKLKSLMLPKDSPPGIRFGLGYSYRPPHGVQFSIEPHENYIPLRNLIYKIQEEGYWEILDESQDITGRSGTVFTLRLQPSFEEFYRLHVAGSKLTRKLQDENYWVQANFQNNEIHLFIGERNNAEGAHAHIILGMTGEIRIDKKDQNPGELVNKVIAITTREGKTIKATLDFGVPDPD